MVRHLLSSGPMDYRALLLLLLFGLGASLPTASAQQRIFQASSAVISDPEETRARQARQEAERDITTLRATGDTTTMEQAREAFVRGDQALVSRSYVSAAAAYREVASLVRRSKATGDRVRTVAKAQQLKAQSSIQSLGRLVTGTLNSPTARLANLALAKFSEAQQLLSSGLFAESARLFEQAEGFARRVARADPAAHDRCDPARENLLRVRDSQQRLESVLVSGSDPLSLDLVARARHLLDEAERQIQGNLCDRSLETSRLAEGLLKRAGEIELQRRR